MADQALRTPSGHPTAYARKKYGFGPNGSYPIWDHKSAVDALNLRGHASPAELAHIWREAAKFAPKETKSAKAKDGKK